MIKELLEKILSQNSLSFDEARTVMMNLMEGSISEVTASAFLAGLRAKGEAPSEIAGFVSVMREKSLKIDYTHPNMIDVCGTGGDGTGTFNISTAVSFVTAGAGAVVAKHGNRSVSSKSGSADVLEHLGVKLQLTPEQATQQLEEIGISFIFAQVFHPAMKFVAPIRRELGVRTIFNMLGPLSNPAPVKKQLVGTYSLKALQLMSEASLQLGYEHIVFLNTNNLYDEISLTEPTTVHEIHGSSEPISYTVSGDSFGMSPVSLSSLQGGDKGYNAKLLLTLLSEPEENELTSVILANSATALYVAGLASDFQTGVALARESLFSKRAYEKLVKLKEASEKL